MHPPKGVTEKWLLGHTLPNQLIGLIAGFGRWFGIPFIPENEGTITVFRGYHDQIPNQQLTIIVQPHRNRKQTPSITQQQAGDDRDIGRGDLRQ